MIRDSGYTTKDVGNNLLFLVESTPMIEQLSPNLKKKFFREVYFLSERKDHVKALGKFDYSLRRKQKLLPFMKKKHPELLTETEFIEESDLYLCDTDSSKSYFLYAYGHKNIFMIEDGARTYRQRHSAFEHFIKTYITKTPVGGGFDREINTIYAQFPDRLPAPIRKKARELNLKKEVARLEAAVKQEIFEIFLSNEEFKIEGNNNALLLTQPISEDKVIKDEAVKIAIYRDVISRIPENFRVILKTHPRETTNYRDYFKDITVLPALFPIEILGLKDGFYFERGYTLFSTALSNLEIVNNRFFLGKDYLDKFTVKATKDLIMNMVVDENA